MAQRREHALDDIAREARELEGIESAAVFVLQPGSAELQLAAAAGVEGPPLEGLKAAVRNPAHPIARTVVDGFATFVWRRLDLATDNIERPVSGVDHGRSYPIDLTDLYYWRPNYWRRD